MSCVQAADPADPLFKNHEALLIGISTYEHEEQISWKLGRIREAHNDAKKLRDTLYQVGYARSRLHCLRNEEASLDRIRAKLMELRQARRGGLLVIFWAGHGVCLPHDRNFLLPWDADLEQLDRTALTMEELAELGAHANVGNLALLLDTCYARPNSQNLVHPKWPGAWPLLSNRVILFAGASTYLAAENSEGGVLTRCLIDGLTACGRDIAEPTGVVYLDALAAYLQWQVRKRASAIGHQYQYPYIASNSSSEIPIGRDLRTHVETRLDACELPEPITGLARRVVRHRWPRSAVS